MAHCILFLKQKSAKPREKQYSEERAQVWRARDAQKTEQQFRARTSACGLCFGQSMM